MSLSVLVWCTLVEIYFRGNLCLGFAHGWFVLLKFCMVCLELFFTDGRAACQVHNSLGDKMMEMCCMISFVLITVFVLVLTADCYALIHVPVVGIIFALCVHTSISLGQKNW